MKTSNISAKKLIQKHGMILSIIGITLFSVLTIYLTFRITHKLFYASIILLIIVFAIISGLLTFKKYIIKYGLIMGLASIILSLYIYLTGYYTKQGSIHRLLLFLIIVTSVLIGLITFKNNNNISLVEALKISIGISLLGGLIAILWKVLLIHAIDPGIIDQINEKHFRRLTENSLELTQNDIDRKLTITRTYTSPLILISIALNENLFWGLILGLIGGLIIRKKKRSF